MERLNQLSNESLWFAWTDRSREPTPAHHAIASLSKRLDSPVFTTNSDQLLQLAGVRPLQSADTILSILAQHSTCLKLRFIFCFTVGETYWLLKLREANPDCVVVAFDLRPDRLTYLRNSDFVVLGDIQQTLPSLYENVAATLGDA